MIIKTDFVTNSSSTVYMVYIPKEYPITVNKMIDKFNEQKQYYAEEDWIDYDSPIQVENACNAALDRLKNEESLYPWDDEVPSLFWNVIVGILEDERLVIQSVETGVSGDDCMIPIKKESIEKIIKVETLYGGIE